MSINSVPGFRLQSSELDLVQLHADLPKQLNNRFNDQNNSSARASRFFVHFFEVHCTNTACNLLICRFMEDVDVRRRIFLSLFEPE